MTDSTSNLVDPGTAAGRETRGLQVLRARPSRARQHPSWELEGSRWLKNREDQEGLGFIEREGFFQPMCVNQEGARTW